MQREAPSLENMQRSVAAFPYTIDIAQEGSGEMAARRGVGRSLLQESDLAAPAVDQALNVTRLCCVHCSCGYHFESPSAFKRVGGVVWLGRRKYKNHIPDQTGALTTVTQTRYGHGHVPITCLHCHSPTLHIGIESVQRQRTSQSTAGAAAASSMSPASACSVPAGTLEGLKHSFLHGLSLRSVDSCCRLAAVAGAGAVVVVPVAAESELALL